MFFHRKNKSWRSKHTWVGDATRSFKKNVLVTQPYDDGSLPHTGVHARPRDRAEG